MTDIFSWMNEQLLRMQWLHDLVRLLVEDVFGLDMASQFGGSVHFFIYDVLKIFILLGTLIFSISWIQSYFPPERTRTILGHFTGIKAIIIGALLGTLTPFCSCSSIPLFMGFTGAGLPLGATFSFLISSPLVDLASVILLASIFSWPIALAYVVVGILLAVLGGALITRLNMERHVETFVFSNRMAVMPEQAMTMRERATFCRDQVIDITRRVWLYILIGVGIGAAIHNWIPESFISALLGQDKWYSVLVATVVGIPMYADIFGTLPIAEALVARGVGLGTALAFMMAVTAMSLPSLIMLRKVIRPPLLATFFGIVAAGIILIGYLFNIASHWLV
mgnify:CR=1 FL=1